MVLVATVIIRTAAMARYLSNLVIYQRLNDQNPIVGRQDFHRECEPREQRPLVRLVNSLHYWVAYIEYDPGWISERT